MFCISFYKFFCLCLKCLVIKFKHSVCKRVKSLFYCDHAACLLLLFEWSPQVFKLSQCCCSHCCFIQRIGQLTLCKDSLYNFKAAFLKIFIRGEKMVTVANLNFVERAMFFLTITSDERNSASFTHQTDNCTHLRYAD